MKHNRLSTLGTDVYTSDLINIPLHFGLSNSYEALFVWFMYTMLEISIIFGTEAEANVTEHFESYT